jgi:hypothetical protein
VCHIGRTFLPYQQAYRVGGKLDCLKFQLVAGVGGSFLVMLTAPLIEHLLCSLVDAKLGLLFVRCLSIRRKSFINIQLYT